MNEWPGLNLVNYTNVPCVILGIQAHENYPGYMSTSPHGVSRGATGAVTPIQYAPSTATTGAPPGHTHSPTAGSVNWTDLSYSTQRYG